MIQSFKAEGPGLRAWGDRLRAWGGTGTRPEQGRSLSRHSQQQKLKVTQMPVENFICFDSKGQAVSWDH